MESTPTQNEAREWLTREDNACYENRLERFEWLSSIRPEGGYHLFFGGSSAKYLFDETEYCFVYGQFLASILSGLAFIEKTLAAQFYATGRDDLVKANVSKILKESIAQGWITNDEFGKLEDVRIRRNPVAHFRVPLARDTIESRAFDTDEHFYTVAEKDARDVIEAVFRILARTTV